MKCEMCQRSLPSDQFARVVGTVICKDCMVGRYGNNTEDALMERAKHVAGQLVSLSPNDIGDNYGKVRSVLADIYAKFGGTTGFAEHMYWVIDKMSQRDPIPASLGPLMLNLLKLHHTVEQTEASISATELSDEQLRRETELATVRMVVDSANDPVKKKLLQQVFSKHGLVLKDASADEVLSVVSEHATDVPYMQDADE